MIERWIFSDLPHRRIHNRLGNGHSNHSCHHDKKWPNDMLWQDNLILPELGYFVGPPKLAKECHMYAYGTNVSEPQLCDACGIANRWFHKTIPKEKEQF